MITYIVCQAGFENFKTSVCFHYSVTMTTDAQQLFCVSSIVKLASYQHTPRNESFQ